MKNRLQLLFVIILVAAAQQCSSISFCQTKYGVPFSYSIHIPIQTGFSNFDNRPPYMTDSHGAENSVIDDNSFTIGVDRLKSYSQVGDTIDIAYYIQSNAPWLVENEYDFHFVIDTTIKELRNILLGSHYHYVATEADMQTNYIVGFKSLPYHLQPDSTIIVSDSGAICRNNIDTIVYYESQYQTYGETNGTVYYSNSSKSFISLTDDTASYKCALTIFPYRQISDVKQENAGANFSITQSLPDRSIYFSFSLSTEVRSLIIYDILGRKILGNEISPGITRSIVSAIGFPKGTYFGVLGSQVVNFQVH